MKKRIYYKKLSRSTTARRALIRSQIRSLLLHGAIKTTLTKAKVTQRHVNKVFTVARKGDFNAKKKVLAFLANDRKTTEKIFAVIKIFDEGDTNFTRTTSMPTRRGDNARVALLQFTRDITKSDKEVSEEKPKKKKSKKETDKLKVKDKKTKKGKTKADTEKK